LDLKNRYRYFWLQELLQKFDLSGRFPALYKKPEVPAGAMIVPGAPARADMGMVTVGLVAAEVAHNLFENINQGKTGSRRDLFSGLFFRRPELRSNEPLTEEGLKTILNRLGREIRTSSDVEDLILFDEELEVLLRDLSRYVRGPPLDRYKQLIETLRLEAQGKTARLRSGRDSRLVSASIRIGITPLWRLIDIPRVILLGSLIALIAYLYSNSLLFSWLKTPEPVAETQVVALRPEAVNPPLIAVAEPSELDVTDQGLIPQKSRPARQGPGVEEPVEIPAAEPGVEPVEAPGAEPAVEPAAEVPGASEKPAVEAASALAGEVDSYAGLFDPLNPITNALKNPLIVDPETGFPFDRYLPDSPEPWKTVQLTGIGELLEFDGAVMLGRVPGRDSQAHRDAAIRRATLTIRSLLDLQSDPSFSKNGILEAFMKVQPVAHDPA
ncbi:MAG: hypothetical protein KDA77_21500, partial [Planctomycetaceae bacterium]|nr:hypothetical protein [Planctomycetaceae bacterium]